MQDKNVRASVSAAKKIKEKNMLRRQRRAVIAMIAAIALLVLLALAVSYIVDIYVYNDVDGTEYYIKKVDGKYALCYKDGRVCDQNQKGYYQTDLGTQVIVDEENGTSETFATVHTSESEVQGFGQYVLMFKQLTYDAGSTKDKSKVISSIEVHNEHGQYTFCRDGNGEFVIKGKEGTPYNKETFAQLAVACGYTLSTRRLASPAKLPDGSIDYAEYGLAPEKREKTETDENGKEITVEYDYTPAWYVISTVSGESYKVIIGDMTVTGTGYYAKMDGRDTIYVIGVAGITDLVLGRVEEIVSPTIAFPMELNNYFNVKDFMIYANIDYERIYAELADKYGDYDELPEEFYEDYEKLFEIYSKKMCEFSFISMEERQGTLNAHSPYVSHLEYAGGYYINSANADVVLYNLYETEFEEVVKLAPTDDELEEYGLLDSKYVIGFLYKTKNVDGEDVYVENFIKVSEKSEDGVFYAYSSAYDMIVAVSEKSFAFLEWEEIEWYDTGYIQLSISNIDKMIIESQGFKTEFEIEDSASKYMSYLEQSGSTINVGDVQYRVAYDDDSGKYVLLRNGERVDAIYNGDYLITPTSYTKGEAEADNYLFSESKEMDANGDGTNDSVMYYFYNVGYNGKEYSLVAQLVYTDYNGNRIAEDKVVWGQSARKTDYFATNSGYMYFTGEETGIGAYLKETYEKYGRGSFGEGNIFVTSGNTYVMVDSKTGDWSIVKNHSEGIYFADRESSRLAQKAVELPTKYYESGKVKRYGETYYPLTAKRIRYNSDTDKIMAYNASKKTWENITHSDCTIGVWGEGSYYALDDGTLVAVNADSGSWGIVSVLTSPVYIADVYADGERLDYTIDNGGDEISAMSNFQELYRAMLYASLEGMAELDDTQKQEFYALDDFSTEDENNPCQLKITIIATDAKGNERNVVYRFYQYSERKSYLTVELLGEDGTSSSEKAYGSFYVLRSFADKIIEDAKRVEAGEQVVSESKY
jgi:hypothetical protein